MRSSGGLLVCKHSALACFSSRVPLSISRSELMKTRSFLSASLLLLALACSGSGTSGSSGPFSGSSLQGITAVGGSVTTELRADETGNSALSVQGPQAEGSSFSLALANGAAAGSVGVSFRVRASSNVRFSVTSPGVVPVEQGGSCVASGSLACWDVHGLSLAVTTGWQTVTISWAQLQQSGTGVAATFSPDQISSLNWQPEGVGAFNVWIDDVVFLTQIDVPTTSPVVGSGSGGSGAAPATGGTTGGGPTGGNSAATGGTTGGSSTTTEWDNVIITAPADNRLGKYVTQAMFNSAFPRRNAIYKYNKLLAAVDHFPDFASCCSTDGKKREVAAFLAHVQHESDNLEAAEEYSPQSVYCTSSAEHACTAGKSYHGRGALQITHNYNYHFAQLLMAEKGKNIDLLARPEQVSVDDELVWMTALWFWMQGDPSYSTTMQSIFASQGFGATIEKINGELECGGRGPSEVTQRVKYFKEWCARLGVDPGADLRC